jgi:hypothetical protein
MGSLGACCLAREGEPLDQRTGVGLNQSERAGPTRNRCEGRAGQEAQEAASGDSCVCGGSGTVCCVCLLCAGRRELG